MTATRSVKATNDRMVYMKKRTYETPHQPILKETSENVLLYEKFHDDTASLNRRIDFALRGAPAIAWEQKFSIEAIFHIEKQAYQGAVVFSNFIDSCGIELINANKESQYVLRWGTNYGITLNLQEGRWYYLVMQTDGQMMNLFLNGERIYTFHTGVPVKPSNRNFFIGSPGRNQQYFTGVISEILIKNGFSSFDEIRQRQRKFEDSLLSN
jgi:hypothetical protein